MKRPIRRWLLAATMLVGCGPNQAAPVATVGPHQGRMLALPDGAGFVEVVAENRPGSGRTLTPEVAAYFFGPDAQAALLPAPTDVALQVYLDEAKEMKPVALKPAPAAAAPQTPRFAATPPPGFDGTLRTGRVNATVAGRAVDLMF